jgi:hypothetical protein
MAYCPRDIGSATTVKTHKLTPEQLHHGIEIGARGNSEERQRQLQRGDWSKAVVIVKRKLYGNAEGPWLTDQQIDPTAREVHKQRLKEERNRLCDIAIAHLEKEGISYPSHQEVLSRAAIIAEEERQALQDKDWLESEESARKLGSVWWPFNKLAEIQP